MAVKRAAVEQRRQHVGASGIADERGDFGERWLNCFHAGENRPALPTMSSRDTTEWTVVIEADKAGERAPPLRHADPQPKVPS